MPWYSRYVRVLYLSFLEVEIEVEIEVELEVDADAVKVRGSSEEAQMLVLERL